MAAPRRPAPARVGYPRMLQLDQISPKIPTACCRHVARILPKIAWASRPPPSVPAPVLRVTTFGRNCRSAKLFVASTSAQYRKRNRCSRWKRKTRPPSAHYPVAGTAVAHQSTGPGAPPTPPWLLRRPGCGYRGRSPSGPTRRAAPPSRPRKPGPAPPVFCSSSSRRLRSKCATHFCCNHSARAAAS